MSAEKRVTQQIRTVERLLNEYERERNIPLARFLTAFYKRNRQMGSNDRRVISRLAYHYFRIGTALPVATVAERLAVAEFLCSSESQVVQYLLPDLYRFIQATSDEKLALLEAHTGFRLADVFPLQGLLSAGMDSATFIKSLFIQPDLFIRIRRGHQREVTAALTDAGVSYRELGEYAVALPNGTQLGHIAGITGKYEVQDYTSQQTAKYVRASAGESWWDACAGAGGKSLLLMDHHPETALLVSDVRGSILRNLDERFDAAGIKSYRKKIIDLTRDTTAVLGNERFDGIILDAPCTGSGTWGRTPEMISSFNKHSIDRFAALQTHIAGNVVKHLKPGKPLVYITCSVFAQENENIVAYLQESHGLQLEAMDLLAGYPYKGDSMFAARLVRG